MNLNALKHKAVDYINHADDDFISMVSVLIDEYEKQAKAGFIVKNTLSKQDLIDNALQASERVKSGKYISQEILEKEVENW